MAHRIIWKNDFPPTFAVGYYTNQDKWGLFWKDYQEHVCYVNAQSSYLLGLLTYSRFINLVNYFFQNWSINNIFLFLLDDGLSASSCEYEREHSKLKDH